MVAIPARLTSLGACMSAAADLHDLAKEEAEALTTEHDEREKVDLDRAYGVVERGRRPREYAPALRDMEKSQKTRAKRRHLDVVDRGLMDLISVYRDVLTLQLGAHSELVNEELRGDVVALANSTVGGAEPGADRGGVRGTRADAGVQRSPAAGTGVDDGRPAGLAELRLG